MNIIYNVMNNLHSRRHSPNQLHDHIQCAATTCPRLRIRVVFIRLRIRLPTQKKKLSGIILKQIKIIFPIEYFVIHISTSINKLIIIELFLHLTNSDTWSGEKTKDTDPAYWKKYPNQCLENPADPQPCTCHMLKQEYRKLSRRASNYVLWIYFSVHFWRVFFSLCT